MSKTEFVPEYDIDVVNMAMSMGWDHNSLLGDFPSHEAIVAHYQKTMSLDFESACKEYRKLIAQEVHEFFEKTMGPRS